MSKSIAKQYQSIDADDEQTTITAHDITMSAAGRAIRDLIGIDGNSDVPPTFEELAQIQRLAYVDTARACATEVQD